MSKIIFATMPAVGHLNAPLKLAKSLATRGHEICYLSGLGYKTYIEDQGLRFITLGESIPDARSHQNVLLELLLEFRSNGQPLDDQLSQIVEIFRREITDLVQNSGRVVYHGLGIKGEMRSTVAQVRALIERVDHTDSYRERVRRW